MPYHLLNYNMSTMHATLPSANFCLKEILTGSFCRLLTSSETQKEMAVNCLF